MVERSVAAYLALDGSYAGDPFSLNGRGLG